MSSSLKRIGSLDIHQDLSFQRRSWIVQRIAWWLLAAVGVGALLGLFGGGPFSSAVADDPSLPFTLVYDRFGRHHSPLVLRIHLKQRPDSGDELAVWVSQDYLQQVRIVRMMPEPRLTLVSSEGSTYRFPLAEGAAGGTITIHLEADAIGALSGRLGLAPDRSLPFTQWIYP
ncbi:MAG TPA: hypothetical protein VJ746_02030 [Nitrospira sp.]|nr:hypothetical protein [Nitrospira sp.]